MANSATVGLLRVLLQADTAQFNAEMKRVSNVADAWAKDLGNIGRQASALGASLTKTLTLPIVGLAAASIKAGLDFESSFANVAKTVDGVSDNAGRLTKEGEALAKTFRQLAKEIPVTTDELNAIAALGGQMGVPIDQLAKFTKHVAALGVAVDGISTEEAAKGLAQIGNVAGVGTSQIAEMASALVHLGNSSNATEADILEFSKRLIGAGHSAGMSIPDVMALGTAMANVGINAEAGGTAMSTMIAKMSMAVSKGGDSLKAFDAIVQHTGENFVTIWTRSPIEAINAVVQGLGKAKESGVDLNLAVGALGATNVRTADTMKRLAGAGDSVATSLVTANDGFRTADKHLIEFEKKSATTANQLKVLWSQIKDLGITIFNSLQPALMALIQAGQKLMPVLDLMVKAIAALPVPVQLLGVGLLGLVAAAGSVIYLFGQLVIAASAVTGAFGKKGLATLALARAQGVLAGSSAGLAGAMGLLGKATAVGAAAFAGWKIGPWIGQVTGATDAVETLAGRLMGLSMAEIEAGRAARKQAEAQKQQTTELDLSTEAAKASTDITTALALAVKDGETAVRGAGRATADYSALLKGSTGASKEAEKAAKELAEQLERERDTLRALGITTNRDVNAALERFAAAQRRATAEGVPATAVAKALEGQLLELAEAARKSGADLTKINAALADVRKNFGAIPKLATAPFDVSKITAGFVKVDLAALKAKMDADDLRKAYDLLGVNIQADLDKAARDARAAYDLIARSGTATSQELQEARQSVVEAERRAARETVDIWQKMLNDITDKFTAWGSSLTGWLQSHVGGPIGSVMGGFAGQILSGLGAVITGGISQLVALGLQAALEGIKWLGGKIWDGLKALGDWLFGGGPLTEERRNELIERGKLIGPSERRSPPGSLSSGFAVPKLGMGGIVSQPTLAMIGERGPEAVIPLSPSASASTSAAGMTINATFNVSTIDGKGVKDFVESRDFAESLIQTIRFNTMGVGSAIRGAV